MGFGSPYANALARSPNGAFIQSHFFYTINKLVQIKYHMCAIADEESVLPNGQSFHFKIVQLLEERRYVNDDSRPNQVRAIRVDESRRQEMEVVGDSVRDDCMPSIVPSCRSGTDVEFGY